MTAITTAATQMLSSTTSSPSQPTTTSSSSSSNNNGNNLRNSSSLLFGFLVTFLALFVVFMVSGLGWRHWMDRRRRRTADALDEIRERKFKEQIPKLWDVWVSPGATQWKSIMPLSIGAARREDSNLESQVPATPGIPSYDRFLGQAFGRFGGRIAIPAPLPEPTLPMKEKSRDHVAEMNTNGLEVAVIITMPKPGVHGNASNEFTSEPLKTSRAGVEDVLKEYALGVTQVHLNRPVSHL